MGNKEIHSTETGLPLGIGSTYKVTTIVGPNGEKIAEGRGNTRAEANKNAQNNVPSGGSSNGGGSGGSSGGDSCCYVTTACLDAMGLPRDSLEMKAMKILTKEHILKSFQGKRDYILYGRKAPRIVSEIESRSDSKEIWGRVYEKLKDITRTVFGGELERGYQSYKSLVNELDS